MVVVVDGNLPWCAGDVENHWCRRAAPPLTGSHALAPAARRALDGVVRNMAVGGKVVMGWDGSTPNGFGVVPNATKFEWGLVI